MRLKRKMIACSFAAVLALATACSAQEAQSGSAENGGGCKMMSGQSDGMMCGDMMGDGMMGDMATIHGLLRNHESIDRRVENIAGGVRTVTTSTDPEVTALIRRHVREMKARYGRGQPIRPMDPVFRELFRHREKASLEIEDVPGGVRVIHTSDDPQVTLLIRQHAHRFVSEAAEQGMRRAMRKTPLPEGYDRMQ
jgi:hypothetical protein